MLVHRCSDPDVALTKAKNVDANAKAKAMFASILSHYLRITTFFTIAIILREQMNALISLIVAQYATTNTDPVLQKQ